MNRIASRLLAILAGVALCIILVYGALKYYFGMRAIGSLADPGNPLSGSIDPVELQEELSSEVLILICELGGISALILLAMAYIMRRSLITPLDALQQAMLETEEVAEDEVDPKAWESLEANLPNFAVTRTFPELNHMVEIYGSMISTLIQRQREMLLQDENLRITFHSIGDGIISTDAIGNIVRMNPVAEQLTGWSEQEAKGRELSDVFTIIDADTREPAQSGTQEILRRAIHEKQSKQHLLVSRDKSEKQISDIAAPIRDGLNQIQGIVLVFRDVSVEYKMRKALQDERTRSLNIIEGTDSGTWDWDIGSNELIINDRWAEIMGYTVDELSPITLDTWKDNVHPVDLKSAEEELNKHLSGESDYYDVEFRQPHKDGHWVWVNARGKVVEWQTDGRPSRMSGTHLDITMRKMAEENLNESRRMLRNVLDSIPVRVFWKDCNSTYLGCNELFAQDVGRDSTEAVIGMNDFQLGQSEHAKDYIKDDHEVIASGQSKLNYEELQVRADGKRVWLKTSKMPLRNDKGEIVGVLGTFEDISLRKKAETDLIAAKEQAEAASRAKDEFLAIMSHEMRTPLNPILGFADLMRQQIKTEPEIGYIDTIISSANRQLRLIDDILDYMRIHSSQVTPTPEAVHIVDLCETAVFDASPLAEHLDIQFVNGANGPRVDPDLAVSCDMIMLRRVLDNLLNNACKYTREGSVTLGLHAEQEDSQSTFVITVTDTGIGINDEMQMHLFEAFRQADSSYTRKHEGLGLGLAITKQLLLILEGEIEVKSELGQGSTFTVRLPLRVIDDTVSVEKKRSEASARKSKTRSCRVLIADDRNDNQLIAQALVEQFGGETVLVSNGAEAIERCNEEHFDAILMDLAMPVTNGLEAAEQIHGTINPNQSTPIIAVTADVSQGVRTRCEMAGIEYYVSKPIIAGKLFDALEDCLAKRSTQLN